MKMAPLLCFIDAFVGALLILINDDLTVFEL